MQFEDKDWLDETCQKQERELDKIQKEEEDLKLGIENFFFLLSKLENEHEELRKQKAAEMEKKVKQKLMQRMLLMPK